MQFSTSWVRVIGAVANRVVAGCSSSKVREDLQPAELKDVAEEVRLDKQWSRSIGDGQGDSHYRLQPAVDAGTVFAASADGVVGAFRLEGGEKLWKVDLDIALSGGVGAGDDLVVVGTSDGVVIALKAADGSEAWRSQVAGEVLSPPAVDGGVVVVQGFDGRVVAFDASSGARRWDYDSSMPALSLHSMSTPRIESGVVFAGFANGRVAAISAENGVPYWEIRVALPQGKSEIERLVDVGGIVVDGNMLYAVSYQGNAMAMDISAGAGRWRQPLSSSETPVLAGSTLFVSEGRGKVVALSAESGEPRWENADLANRQLTAPAVLGGYVAVGDFEGYLHLLSVTDGHLAGRKRVDSDGLRAPLLAHDNYLITYANSGDLVVYSLEQ